MSDNYQEICKVKEALTSLEKYQSLKQLIYGARKNDKYTMNSNQDPNRKQQYNLCIKFQMIHRLRIYKNYLLSGQIDELFQLIKDIMNSKNTSFFEEVAEHLLPNFEQIAHQQSLDQAAHKNTKLISQLQIENSFIEIILESLKVWAQRYPRTRFLVVYNRLVGKGVIFPAETQYYHQDTSKQLSDTRIVEQLTNQSNHIPQHLFDELFKERDLLMQLQAQTRFQQNDTGQLNSTYLNVKNIFVMYPQIKKQLPSQLVFFLQYMKDYEIFMICGMTFEQFMDTLSVYFSHSVSSEDPYVTPFRTQNQQTYTERHNRNVSPNFSNIRQKGQRALTQNINFNTNNFLIDKQQENNIKSPNISENRPTTKRDLSSSLINQSPNTHQNDHQLTLLTLQSQETIDLSKQNFQLQNQIIMINEHHSKQINKNDAQIDELIKQQNMKDSKLILLSQESFQLQNQNQQLQQQIHMMNDHQIKQMQQKEIQIVLLTKEVQLKDAGLEKILAGQIQNNLDNSQTDKKQSQINEIKHLHDRLESSKNLNMEIQRSLQKSVEDTQKTHAHMIAASKSQTNQLVLITQENLKLNQQLQLTKDHHIKEINDYTTKVSDIMEQNSMLTESCTEKDRKISKLLSQISDKNNSASKMDLQQQLEHERINQLLQQSQQHNQSLTQDNSKLKEEVCVLKSKQPLTPQKRDNQSQRIFDKSYRFVTPERRIIDSEDKIRSRSSINDKQVTNKQENFTLYPVIPIKHSQIIYPYQNAHDYYKDKISQQIKGQIIKYKSWTPDTRQDLKNYKLIMLEQNQILLQNQQLSLYANLQPQMIDGQRQICLNLKVISHQPQPTQVMIEFQLAKELQAQGNKQVSRSLSQQSPISLSTEIKLLVTPLSQSKIHIKFFIIINSSAGETQTISLYLPISIISFFEFTTIEINQFKTKWTTKKNNLIRSKPFRYNQSLLQSAWDVQKFLSNLIILNPHKVEEYVIGIDELKFGGQWILNGEILLLKLTFTPLQELTVQVFCDDNLLGVQVINTIQYLFN